MLFTNQLYMAFLQWKSCKKHWILLKATFGIPLFDIKKVLEQTAAFDYSIKIVVIFYMINKRGIEKKLSYSHICCQFSCFIFQFIVFKIFAKNLSNSFSLLQSWLKM